MSARCFGGQLLRLWLHALRQFLPCLYENRFADQAGGMGAYAGFRVGSSLTGLGLHEAGNID